MAKQLISFIPFLRYLDILPVPENVVSHWTGPWGKKDWRLLADSIHRCLGQAKRTGVWWQWRGGTILVQQSIVLFSVRSSITVSLHCHWNSYQATGYQVFDLRWTTLAASKLISSTIMYDFSAVLIEQNLGIAIYTACWINLSARNKNSFLLSKMFMVQFVFDRFLSLKTTDQPKYLSRLYCFADDSSIAILFRA